MKRRQRNSQTRAANGTALARVSLFAIAILIAGCSHAQLPAAPNTISLISSGFRDGATLPAKYTCAGGSISPPLAWKHLPAHTVSLALILQDPDAPNGTFTHWLLFDIAPTSGGFKEGQTPAGSHEGMNDFGRVGYGAPCPPPGRPHRYVFTIYALDNTPNLGQGASKAAFFNALQGHVLAQGRLMGRYGKPASLW